MANGKSYEIPLPKTDISFVSSRRNHFEPGRTHPRLSNNSDINGGSFESFTRQNMEHTVAEMRRLKLEISGIPCRNCKQALTPKQKATELNQWNQAEAQKLEAAKLTEEAAISMEMRRLKLELKQTMELISNKPCKEALTAKQKATELNQRKQAEAQAQKEAKALAALEAAEAQHKIAKLETQKRVTAHMQALKESQEKRKVLDALAKYDVRYKKYSIEEIEVATEYFAENRKIGEGVYGPVYKGYLDHTAVAIKVLLPCVGQRRSQFQQELEVLSCIRHPNMVLLLGACPEYGCLVYEYMANGSLDDRLFCRGNTPVLSWQLRFRIAAEIATGLLFLHRTKPEPLVHRNLKPGNILLDRNYVSKISDVGLARVVPPSVANNVTQYRMTSTAGTFCYIDPEYQQTGMLGIKSDIYALGIMLLQLVTGRKPMGLAPRVERAIEQGTFTEMLDRAVPDWPVEDALIYAKLALRCAELRRRDRPDLGKEVLPELNRLRSLAEESMPNLEYSDDSPKSVLL